MEVGGLIRLEGDIVKDFRLETIIQDYDRSSVLDIASSIFQKTS